MHDQLLGYLLKALEPAEHAAVEERIGKDATLQADLARLRRSLDPLAADLVRRQVDVLAATGGLVSARGQPQRSRSCSWQDMILSRSGS